MSTVLVTGAAKRLGRAIAEGFAANGWDVAAHYWSSETDALDLVASVERMGRKCTLVKADLADETQVRAIVTTAAKSAGHLTALVNCASVFEDDRFDTVTRKSWDTHLNVNLRAPLVLSQEFAKQISASESGSIVNVIDQTVLNLTPQFLSYTISKSALWTLTQTMAQALGPRIRVNAIAPGPSLKAARQSQENFDKQVRSTLLQRPSAPRDIADAIMYLVRAPSITGQMIAVDSGQHLAWSSNDFVE